MIESIARAQVEEPETRDQVSLEHRRTPELVFALVGPVASGVTTTAKKLEALLKSEYGYGVEYYKVSDIIAQCAPLVGKLFPENAVRHERTQRLQDIGNELRKVFSSQYLIKKCVEKIAIQRVEKSGYKQVGDIAVPMPIRQAHIIDSLKHPEEVRILRDVYGEIFWLLTVFAPEEVRDEHLGQSGAEHLSGAVRRRLGPPAALAVLARANRRRAHRWPRLPPAASSTACGCSAPKPTRRFRKRAIRGPFLRNKQ